MTIDASARIDAGERAALPPPRPFGETNTLTVALPRGRRTAASRGIATRIVEAAGQAEATLRVGIVAADAGAITLTV